MTDSREFRQLRKWRRAAPVPGVAIADRKICAANRAARKLLGATPSKVRKPGVRGQASRRLLNSAADARFAGGAWRPAIAQPNATLANWCRGTRRGCALLRALQAVAPDAGDLWLMALATRNTPARRHRSDRWLSRGRREWTRAAARRLSPWRAAPRHAPAAATTAEFPTPSAAQLVSIEWQAAMDAFEDPVYLLDLDDRILRVNAAFCHMVGGTPETLIGREITAVMHPQGEAHPCPVCQARARREDAYIVLEADHPNNKAGRPREITVRMLRDPQGEAVGVLMGMRDLTRARAAEAQLNRLNEHVALLLESTGEGIFGIDEQGRCTFINRAAAEIFGCERHGMIGRDMYTVVGACREDGSLYSRSECRILRTVREGQHFHCNGDVHWHTAWGPVPMEYSSHPIRESDRTVGAVVVFRSVAEQRALARKMDYLARHDPLTGLANRREFEAHLHEALAWSKQSDRSSLLCYLDLDQFKVVNDTCGHSAGDQLLQQLTGLLQAQMHGNDLLARLGGDEFGILLKDCAMPEALQRLGRLRDTVRDYRFQCDGKTFVIGTSVGVVDLSAQMPTIREALSMADAACYLAKDSGRNRIHIYQPDDVDIGRRQGEMHWVSRIHAALEHNELELFFQTIEPNGRAGLGTHLEILVRMRDGNGGFVLPGAFVPAAERYGVMTQIDRWVVENALQWLQCHSGAEQVDLCAINLSGHSFSDEHFAAFIVEELRKRGIPGARICFELTETAAVSHLPRALHNMRALKAVGCQFALDDFGNGMSSFGYLKTLPVDFLKIDGHFVRDIVDDPVDFAMVDAINTLGHVMGLRIIAEFVETDAIRDTVCGIGVDYLQGYAISAPLPLRDWPRGLLPS
jgi:diguanylate cyclase (GGDEF)-like protein/PAS domain S-box-containing protein